MIKYYNNGKCKVINVNIEIEINDNESIISSASSIPSCVSVLNINNSYIPQYDGELVNCNSDRCHNQTIKIKIPKRIYV